MTEVSRRRANQFRNFVRVLKLSAVNLYNCVLIAEQNFSRGFNDTRLSRSCGTEEQHRADRPINRVQACEENLVEPGHAAYRTFLSDNARFQTLFEILRARAL